MFIPSLAMATLGEDRSTVAADARALGAAEAPVMAKAEALGSQVQMHTITAGPVTVKEFSDGSGKVFAISTHGLNFPSMKVLLGSFFEEFTARDQQMPKGRRYLRQPVITDHVKVSRGGLPMNLYSLIILNGHLPAGVKAEDLL